MEKRSSDILMLQDDLAKKFKYKELPQDISYKARQYYKDTIPSSLYIKGDADFKIYSKYNTLISIGYERIVIGDYGAFIEIREDQIIKSDIIIKSGQEYRINDSKYNKNIKYHWLTTNDKSGIKIYHQQKTVSYADYKTDMYYISPFEILI